MTLRETYDALLLDLDGTVYEGGQAIAGAVDSLAACRVPLLYVTNNASRPAADVATQLTSLGLPTDESAIVTSADMGVKLLAEIVEPGATVLIVGTDFLAQHVHAAGFVATRTADDHPAAVIHGHNTATGWQELSEAALAIRQGAVYVATNRDATIPQERGLMVGNGSMIAAVMHATGVQPRSAGKPEPDMFLAAAQRAGATRPLVVGDRLDTDIQGGNAAGFDTLEVLTGVNGPADLLCAPVEQRPTFVAADLTALDASVDSVRPGPVPGVDTQIGATGDITVRVDESAKTLGSVDVVRAVLGCGWAAASAPSGRVTGENEAAARLLKDWWS